ncbi:hypothetical protein [Candidatus Uabimicrobium amorphum]|uniref:Uncharacterized protein n=1 Tax=Uabimicrobium amorphum TaxID=2596890 RepID=A0A5S9IQB0_UABAM|nr:hypothetical protein [Candidatus Uabimicrobium amorphum]BBM86099.1 hypothetical protein UABAM_04485 [Candidatus Uabimicrobium amorphum]
MNIEKILSADCRHFEAKMFVFSIVEEWTPVNRHQKILQHFCAQLPTSYETQYYQTLFHLLTCPFCLARSPILRENTTPDLWRISQCDFTLPPDSPSYQKLLYEKLYMRSGIPFIFRRGAWEERQIPQIKAAGISQGFPSQINLPPFLLEKYGEISFKFTMTKQGHMEISLEGGSFALRSRIHIELVYQDHRREVLYGKDVAMAGAWKIELEKVARISSVIIDFEER